jgi:hypothetical protein
MQTGVHEAVDLQSRAVLNADDVVEVASSFLHGRGFNNLEAAIWSICPTDGGWMITVHNLEGKYKHPATWRLKPVYRSDSARFRMSQEGQISQWKYGIWEPSQTLLGVMTLKHQKL